MTERSYSQVVAARTRQEIAEFENDRRAQLQRELDYWMEQKLCDREYDRELQRRLDPYNYGHWR